MTKKPLLLFKYGGNAMTDDDIKIKVLQNITELKKSGYDVVIVHGGGPFIRQELERAGIQSEFIAGHRVTTEQAYYYVAMALKGIVNFDLVSIMNRLGNRAVGISGIDGKLVTASKRKHQSIVNGNVVDVDLGRVGDVDSINPELIHVLLQSNYIPVVACLAADEEGIGYNINGDMFAGHLAGALRAEQFIVLTDVDGILLDKENKDLIIHELNLSELDHLYNKKVIQGGMIPKADACKLALRKGAKSVRIINGTKPAQILSITNRQSTGTLIRNK